MLGHHLGRDPRYYAELPHSRKLTHALDFNSLRSYNDAAPPGRRKVRTPATSLSVAASI